MNSALLVEADLLDRSAGLSEDALALLPQSDGRLEVDRRLLVVEGAVLDDQVEVRFELIETTVLEVVDLPLHVLEAHRLLDELQVVAHLVRVHREQEEAVGVFRFQLVQNRVQEGVERVQLELGDLLEVAKHLSFDFLAFSNELDQYARLLEVLSQSEHLLKLGLQLHSLFVIQLLAALVGLHQCFVAAVRVRDLQTPQKRNSVTRFALQRPVAEQPLNELISFWYVD